MADLTPIGAALPPMDTGSPATGSGAAGSEATPHTGPLPVAPATVEIGRIGQMAAALQQLLATAAKEGGETLRPQIAAQAAILEQAVAGHARWLPAERQNVEALLNEVRVWLGGRAAEEGPAPSAAGARSASGMPTGHLLAAGLALAAFVTTGSTADDARAIETTGASAKAERRHAYAADQPADVRRSRTARVPSRARWVWTIGFVVLVAALSLWL